MDLKKKENRVMAPALAVVVIGVVNVALAIWLVDCLKNLVNGG